MISKPTAAALGRALALLLILMMPVSGQGAESIRDKFLSSNPNRDGWEVGYLQDGDYIAYNSTFDDGHGIAGWALNNAPGPDGDITINYTDRPIDRYGVHWEPGQVCAHSPVHGDGIYISYTISDSGDVQIATRLVTQTPGADVDVELWAGNTQLVGEQIGGAADEVSSLALLPAREARRNVLERSSRTRVTRGSKVRLVIKSSDEAVPCYVAALIDISSPVASAGMPQRMTFGLDTRLPSVRVTASNTSTVASAQVNEVTQ